MDIGRSLLNITEPRARLDAGTWGTMGVGLGCVFIVVCLLRPFRGQQTPHARPVYQLARPTLTPTRSHLHPPHTRTPNIKQTSYAIAAATVHPDRHVFAIEGDSAFGFSGMEARRHVSICVCVYIRPFFF